MPGDMAAPGLDAGEVSRTSASIGAEMFNAFKLRLGLTCLDLKRVADMAYCVYQETADLYRVFYRFLLLYGHLNGPVGETLRKKHLNNVIMGLGPLPPAPELHVSCSRAATPPHRVGLVTAPARRTYRVSCIVRRTLLRVLVGEALLYVPAGTGALDWWPQAAANETSAECTRTQMRSVSGTPVVMSTPAHF